jgi:hypothetical protein
LLVVEKGVVVGEAKEDGEERYAYAVPDKEDHGVVVESPEVVHQEEYH